jgi:hypothetical protein
VRTLAHELVHAAQERDIGFATFDTWIDSVDSGNATGSLIEGEAMLYENLVDAKLRKLSADRINWTRYHSDWIAATREEIASDASPYRLASSGLRYPLGSAYFSQAYVEGAQLGVRKAMAAHPETTVQLMLGRSSPPAAISCSDPEPPDGYQGVRSDQLGAYSLYAFATRLFPNEDDRAWASASAWDGDRFVVYATPSMQLSVLWLLRFRTPEDAQAVQQALSESPLSETVQSVLDGEVLHVFASPVSLDGYDAWRTCHMP